jgi:uncharacterized damage-inducible protein DinB
MNKSGLYLIQDIPGFTPQISRLVSMMNYARWTTIEEVEDLTREQLDHLHDESSNSIGALLRHIAAVEVSYQAATFESRQMNKREIKEWSAALRLGARARREIRGYDLDHYLKVLEDVRARTLAELAGRDDNWLHEETPFWNNQPANNWFKWFHVFEDEINHRGQIRWLRKRLPEDRSARDENKRRK